MLTAATARSLVPAHSRCTGVSFLISRRSVIRAGRCSRSEPSSLARGGPSACRRGPNLVRHDPAPVQADQPVADPVHAVQVVGDHHDGQTLAAPQVRRAPGSAPPARVHPARRGARRVPGRPGRRARIPASATRRCWPPLSSSMRRSPSSPTSSPTAARAAATAWSSGAPAARTSWATVARWSCRRACWNARPTEPTRVETGWPPSRATPRLGRRTPAMIQASVDLPEPFPPTISTPSRGSIVRSMPARASCAHGVPAP